jgi:class 3 adenylate cyclase
MKGRFRLSSILFYGISGIVVLVAIISFINALSWINKPFPGFLVYKDPVLGSFGPKAGLKYLDRIVTVDGQPIRDGNEIVQAARAKRAGTPVKYLVETKGERREIAIPVAIFTLKDFLFIFFTIFLGGLIFYALGFIVYFMKPNMRLSWIFLLAMFGQAIYMVTGFEIQSTYTLVRFHYFVLSLYPAVLFHLGLVFPERKKILNRFWALEYLIYLPASILAVAFVVHFWPVGEISDSSLTSSVKTYIKLASLARFILLFCVLGWAVLAVHSLFKATDIQSKQRARMILFGVTVGAAPCVVLMALAHFLRVYFPWNFMIFFLVFFPASIAYSIIRHNLFDADAIIKRTVGYVVVTAVVVGAYVVVSILFNVFLGQYQISQSRIFPIVFTLVIILIFNPLRDRIQSLVDRIFFRKEYDYGEIIHRIGGAMTSLLDLGQILKQMARTFIGDMFINTTSIMLLNPALAEYQVYLADGEKKGEIEKVVFKKDQPLMQIIEREKRELTKYDVIEDPKYREVSGDCVRNFETVSASLMVPLVFQDEVIGVISLGEKKSGKFYNREDIDLLRTLANQGAVAIENARLVDQMKSEEAVRTNLARYLSPQIVDQVIKKDVQVNLGGDRKVVTVLFSDIRNFTRISESLPPDKLVQLLNEYFTEMARIIFENQGSLDKYIGDAIVAVFGSLIPLKNPGQTAVHAAVQMMKELSSLNERWKNEYGFRMDIGIGINTGEVFLGNIGSPERMEFTVIGDTVNIASRFSDIAKPGQILITKETSASLGPDIRHNELPPTEVKGKSTRLEVFEILY